MELMLKAVGAAGAFLAACVVALVLGYGWGFRAGLRQAAAVERLRVRVKHQLSVLHRRAQERRARYLAAHQDEQRGTEA